MNRQSGSPSRSSRPSAHRVRERVPPAATVARIRRSAALVVTIIVGLATLLLVDPNIGGLDVHWVNGGSRTVTLRCVKS